MAEPMTRMSTVLLFSLNRRKEIIFSAKGASVASLRLERRAERASTRSEHLAWLHRVCGPEMTSHVSFLLSPELGTV